MPLAKNALDNSHNPEPTPYAPLLAKFFRGLGDPTRLRILELLLDQKRPVKELVALIGTSQSQISNHLACLKWCGYVSTRSQGRFVYYSVGDPRVRDLIGLGRSILADNIERVCDCTRITEEKR